MIEEILRREISVFYLVDLSVVDEAILGSVSDKLGFSTWMIGQRTDD